MSDISKEAITLGLLMLDPENQPPQLSQLQAFGRFQELQRQFLNGRAGAGGRALALAETYQQEVEPMTEEEKPDEEMEESEQEQATFTEQEEPEMPAPEKLVQEKVHEALTKTNLPPASVLKLAEAEYSDEAGLQEAIRAEVAEVKARTGSGKPFGQGEGTAPLTKASLTEKERVERFNDIMRQVGARTVEV